MVKAKAGAAGETAADGFGARETMLKGGYRRPVQVRAASRKTWTQRERRQFLETLATTCNVLAATRAVGRSASGAYSLRRHDTGFAAAWQDALTMGYERLNEALLRMALHGVEPAGGSADDEGDAFGDGRDTGVGTDGAGTPVLSTPESVRLALTLLSYHRASVTGTGRRMGRVHVARPEETDAALRKLLDGLAKRRAIADQRKADAASTIAEAECVEDRMGDPGGMDRSGVRVSGAGD